MKITTHPLFWSIALSITAFIGVFFTLGAAALFLVIVLSILEVTLSFDNAVINARVLERMSPVWQHRFLTWGILVAVFGTRFILPIIIVSVAVWTSPWYITELVFNNPTEYGRLLDSVHGVIAAFGGIFLLMVSLKYFLVNHPMLTPQGITTQTFSLLSQTTSLFGRYHHCLVV